MTFQGIPISEFRLWFEGIVFTALTLVMIAVLIWAIVVVLPDKEQRTQHQKSQQRIRNLSKQSKTDERAARELQKRKRKHTKQSCTLWARYTIVILFVIALIGVFLFGALPCWQDLILKDYALYSGPLTVEQKNLSRQVIVTLEDGTTLWGTGLMRDEDIDAIVYSRRTELVLGWSQ